MFKKTLLLSAISMMPLASNATIAQASTNSSSIQLNNYVNEQEEQTEACTFMYVGKDVSQSGKTIVARSGDSSPRTMIHYTRVFAHNELANKVVKGKNGFEWTMPSTTYRYISTPRNPNFQRGINWEVSGMNEKGVGVSATLTCYPSAEALDADPYVSAGISEDNIAQIVAATADSAKKGVQVIANIIDTIGSAESNAIMITDKDETWYMEMYTGHQYVAVKMPTDKACTIGNEFMLNTISELNLASSDDYIVSQDLLAIAKGEKGETKGTNFAVFDSSGEQTVEHLHLYNSYAGDSSYKKGKFSDGCHMRTWIGRYRFAKSDEQENYSDDGTTCAQRKYSPFFTPNPDVNGGKLSENDVISFMRDRFETVLSGSVTDPNTMYFTANKSTLRVVGIENAYNIHVISVDPDLPSEIAVTNLMCFSNSNYAPFIPFNNGMNSFENEYTRVVSDFTYDDNSAAQIYKKLNALAAVDRTNYGLPITACIQEYEQGWQLQYNDFINQTKDKSLSIAKDALTNYCRSLEVKGLELSKTLYNDLLFHIENTIVGTVPTAKLFKPLVNLESYAKMYGWTYKREDKKVTLTSNNDTIVVNLDYKWEADKGNYFSTFKVNDAEEQKTIVHLTNNVPYIQYDGTDTLSTGIKSYITNGREIVKVKLEDYITKSNQLNPLLWIIPSLVGIPLITGAIVVPIVFSKRKKLNSKVRK